MERNLGLRQTHFEIEGSGDENIFLQKIFLSPLCSKYIHSEYGLRGRTVGTDNLDQSGIGIIVDYAAIRHAAGRLHNNLLFRVALRPP